LLMRLGGSTHKTKPKKYEDASKKLMSVEKECKGKEGKQNWLFFKLYSIH